MTTLTWTGAVDADVEDGANWSPEQDPTSADALIVNGDTSNPITFMDNLSSGHFEFGTIDFTGYTGNVNMAGGYFRAHGGTITLSNGMTFTGGVSGARFKVASGSPSTAITLGTNMLVSIRPEFVGTLTIDHATGTDLTCTGAATIWHFLNEVNTDSFNIDGSNSGPVTVDGNMTLHDAGANLDELSVIVGGNLVLNGFTMLNGNFDVTGTANATGGTLTGNDFSAGTALTTSGSTNGGGNLNVVFPPIVWDGSESTDTTDADNWTPSGVPTSSNNVEINDDAPGDVVGAITCKDIDFTDFAGEYDGTLSSYGSILLESGMTITTDFDCYAAGSLTSNGVQTAGLDLKVDSGARTLTDNLACGFEDASGSATIRSGATLEMGTKTLTATIETEDEDGLFFLEGSNVTFSGAAKIIGITASPDTETYFDLQAEESLVLPPVEVTDLILVNASNNDLVMTSLVNTDGGFYCDLYNFETTGNMNISGGLFTTDGMAADGLNGLSLVVGGNLTINGTLGLTDGELDVTGTATVSNCTISNMTSTGPVNCTVGCTNGGGNDANFDFGNAVPVADAGSNQIIEPGDTCQLDGSATDEDEEDELVYTWSKLSGPGTVTFLDASDPQTTCEFSEKGEYVLRLTVDDGDDIDTDDISVLVDFAPLAYAGKDITVDLDTGGHPNSHASDEDADSLTYLWEKVSGPDTVTFDDDNILRPHVTFGAVGTYVLRLTADDGDIQTADTVSVLVLPAGTMQGQSQHFWNAPPTYNGNLDYRKPY